MPSPIVLLKSPSPSPPLDPYTCALSPYFDPHFVPVLTHTLLPDPFIKLLLTYLDPSSATSNQPFPYGALIITSQRAVAALNTALTSPILQNKIGKERLASLCLRLYVVGPATEKATRQVAENWLPGCDVLGGREAGSGEQLARFMLGENGDGSGIYEAYKGIEGQNAIQSGKGGRRKPVLFLTGEKRRDILPNMLQSQQLSERDRIKVDEMVIYQSSELQQFEFEYSNVLQRTDGSKDAVRWTVMFSPMAAKGMLRSLGWLQKTVEKADRVKMQERTDFICCIGPTTRAYLSSECGLDADAMAVDPSPHGVKEAILEFMTKNKHQELNHKAP